MGQDSDAAGEKPQEEDSFVLFGHRCFTWHYSWFLSQAEDKAAAKKNKWAETCERWALSVSTQ
eukprot:37783-Amphidinium_carterae.1